MSTPIEIMKNIFKKSVKYISLFIAVFCISQAGGWTSAYATISQSTHDIRSANINATFIYQSLGTGLEGTLTNGKLYFDITQNDYNGYLSAKIYEFDNESSYLTAISNIDMSGAVRNTGDMTLATRPYSVQNDLLTTFAPDPEFIFNANKYYILQTGNNNLQGGSSQYVKGTTTNSYLEGQCFGACGTLQDIYFEINGIGGGVDTSTRIVSSIPFPQIKVSAYMQSSNGTIFVPDTSLFYVGQTVLSIHLPAETYITSIVDGNTLEISNTVNEGTPSGYYDLSVYTTLETHSKPEIQVYINSSDWVEGMFLKVTFSTVKDTMLGGDVINAVNGYYTKEIEIPSDFGFNEIRTFDSQIIDVLFETHEGINYADFYLGYHNTGFWNSVANFFGFDIDSTYFDQRHFAFVVNAISEFDTWFNNGRSVLANEESVIGSIVENAINTTHSTCNFAGSFDFGDCLAFLFLPTPYDLKLVWEDFSSDVLSVFPLGYVTRMVDIFVNTGAVKPPALTYTFSDTNDSSVSGTGLEGATLSFQIFDHFDVLNSINSDQADNKNIWDIIMPFFNTLVSLAVFLVILGDIMGGGFNTDTSDITDYAKNNVRFSKAELQKLNNPTIAKTEQEYKLYKKL